MWGACSESIPGPSSGDGEDRLIAAHGDVDLHGGPRRCVHLGVGEEVGGHLAQPLLVARDNDVPVLAHGDRPSRIPRACVLGGVERDRHEIDSPPDEGPALIETCEQQHVVDQRAHPRRL